MASHRVTLSTLGYELFDRVIDKFTIPMNRSMVYSVAWIANAQIHVHSHTLHNIGRQKRFWNSLHTMKVWRDKRRRATYLPPTTEKALQLLSTTYRRQDVYSCAYILVLGGQAFCNELFTHTPFVVTRYRRSAWRVESTNVKTVELTFSLGGNSKWFYLWQRRRVWVIHMHLIVHDVDVRVSVM